MKLNGHIIAYGILILVILFLLNTILAPSNKSGMDKSDSASMWTVYGTNGCGWTRKQIEVMKSKNIPYKFIDCETNNCDGITAFPTLIDPSGEKSVGFKNL